MQAVMNALFKKVAYIYIFMERIERGGIYILGLEAIQLRAGGCGQGCPAEQMVVTNPIRVFHHGPTEAPPAAAIWPPLHGTFLVILFNYILQRSYMTLLTNKCVTFKLINTTSTVVLRGSVL